MPLPIFDVRMAQLFLPGFKPRQLANLLFGMRIDAAKDNQGAHKTFERVFRPDFTVGDKSLQNMFLSLPIDGDKSEFEAFLLQAKSSVDEDFEQADTILDTSSSWSHPLRGLRSGLALQGYSDHTIERLLGPVSNVVEQLDYARVQLVQACTAKDADAASDIVRSLPYAQLVTGVCDANFWEKFFQAEQSQQSYVGGELGLISFLFLIAKIDRFFSGRANRSLFSDILSKDMSLSRQANPVRRWIDCLREAEHISKKEFAYKLSPESPESGKERLRRHLNGTPLSPADAQRIISSSSLDEPGKIWLTTLYFLSNLAVNILKLEEFGSKNSDDPLSDFLPKDLLSVYDEMYDLTRLHG